jgi:hypothetical protein
VEERKRDGEEEEGTDGGLVVYICRIMAVAALLGVLGKMGGLYVLDMGIIWLREGLVIPKTSQLQTQDSLITEASREVHELQQFVVHECHVGKDKAQVCFHVSFLYHYRIDTNNFACTHFVSDLIFTYAMASCACPTLPFRTP